MTTETHKSGGVSLTQAIQKPHHKLQHSVPNPCQEMPRSVTSTVPVPYRQLSLSLLPGYSLRVELGLPSDACSGFRLQRLDPLQNILPLPCLQSSFKETALKQLPKQVSQYWMPPVLGQQSTHFRTGHPSFSRFSLSFSLLVLSMFPLKPCSTFSSLWSSPLGKNLSKCGGLQQCIILPRTKLV